MRKKLRRAKAEGWLEHAVFKNCKRNAVLKGTLQWPNACHYHIRCSLPKKHSDKVEKIGNGVGWAGKEETPLDNR